MIKIRINFKILIVFIVLVLAIASAYFLVLMELSDLSTTTTLPETTTMITTTMPHPATSTVPPELKHLVDLANKNIQDRCNVAFNLMERKHFPASQWFSYVCPNFNDYNETELWRTSAYLNNECDTEKEHGCIEVFTSISLDEKTICVWGMEHPLGEKLPLGNLTQEYC